MDSAKLASFGAFSPVFARPAQLIGVLLHAVRAVERCIQSCIVAYQGQRITGRLPGMVVNGSHSRDSWSTAVRVSDSPPTVLVQRLRAVAVYDLMPRNCARGRDRYAFGGRSISPLADMLIGQGAHNSLHTRCAEFKISLTQDLQFADVFVATSCAARRKKIWKIFCVVH